MNKVTHSGKQEIVKLRTTIIFGILEKENPANNKFTGFSSFINRWKFNKIRL